MSVFCVQGLLRKGTVFGPYTGYGKQSHDDATRDKLTERSETDEVILLY